MNITVFYVFVSISAMKTIWAKKLKSQGNIVLTGEVL